MGNEKSKDKLSKALEFAEKFGEVLTEATIKAARIGHLSASTGLSTKEIQQLRFAFVKVGVSQENLDAALLTFGKRLGDAQLETGELVNAFKSKKGKLLKDLNDTSSMSDALKVLFESLNGDEDNKILPRDKIAILSAAFGDVGEHMAAAFKKGTKEFNASKAEAVELELIIDEKKSRQR